VLTFAAYRTPFAVIRTENDWVFGYVQGSGRPGYIHLSALSPVKVTLGADALSAPPALQESEIVLAGKGFSSSLESALREGNAFNFAAVDDMVTLTYPYAECLAFIQGPTFRRENCDVHRVAVRSRIVAVSLAVFLAASSFVSCTVSPEASSYS
jgi:hypothetical protein